MKSFISTVVRGFDRKENLHYAIKRVHTSTCQHWEKEWQLLKMYAREHVNVVTYLESWFHDDSDLIYFKMVLCDGNLRQYIKNDPITPWTKGNCEEQLARDYFGSNIVELLYQTAKGIKYIHSFGIIHRDLKPCNILLHRTGDNKTIAKVSDFGLSKTLDGNASVYTGTLSTNDYMPSEGYDRRWKQSSDMFSYGVLCYFAVTGGENPFGKEDYEIKKNVKEKNPPNMDMLRKDSQEYSEERRITLIDMIKRLIRHKPEDRITVDDVLRHPTFFTNEDILDFLRGVKVLWDDTTNFLTLCEYNRGLIDDSQENVWEDYNIQWSDLPKYLTSLDYFKEQSMEPPKHWKRYIVQEEHCKTVKDWLRILRNRFEHANVLGMPCDYYDKFCLEVKGVQTKCYRPDPEKFLKFFLSDHHPQLLVNLYEFIKEKIEVDANVKSLVKHYLYRFYYKKI